MAPNSCVLAPVMHVVPFTPWISVCPPYAVLTETRFSPRRCSHRDVQSVRSVNASLMPTCFCAVLLTASPKEPRGC